MSEKCEFCQGDIYQSPAEVTHTINRCENAKCGHQWLDPSPDEAALMKERDQLRADILELRNENAWLRGHANSPTTVTLRLYNEYQALKAQLAEVMKENDWNKKTALEYIGMSDKMARRIVEVEAQLAEAVGLLREAHQFVTRTTSTDEEISAYLAKHGGKW